MEDQFYRRIDMDSNVNLNFSLFSEHRESKETFHQGQGNKPCMITDKEIHLSKSFLFNAQNHFFVIYMFIILTG